MEWWGVGMVVCLEQGADLYMFQLMPLPLTVSCFSKIQIGFSFLVPAHLGSPGERAVKRVCALWSGKYAASVNEMTSGVVSVTQNNICYLCAFSCPQDGRWRQHCFRPVRLSVRRYGSDGGKDLDLSINAKG